MVREAGIEAVHHRVVLETKAAGSAGGDVVIIHWEVAVAIGIGAGWSYMGRVKDVGIDEDELRSS